MKKRDDVLTVEVTNRGIEVEKNEIPLTSITNQDEYDLDLEITNKENDKEILLTIKLNMTFIWSFEEKYQNEYDLNKKKLDKISSIVEKSKKIRDSLDKPFSIFSKIEEDNKNNNAPGNKKRGTSTQEYAWADKIEGNLKSTLNMKTIQWGWFTKLLLLILLVLSFLNMFTRADFINILLPVYMLAIFSTSLQSKLINNLQLFFIASTLTLGTDFLWLFFRSSVSFIYLYL